MNGYPHVSPTHCFNYCSILGVGEGRSLSQPESGSRTLAQERALSFSQMNSISLGHSAHQDTHLNPSIPIIAPKQTEEEELSDAVC